MLAVLIDKTVSKLDTARNIARLDHLEISRSGFTVRPDRSSGSPGRCPGSQLPELGPGFTPPAPLELLEISPLGSMATGAASWFVPAGRD